MEAKSGSELASGESLAQIHKHIATFTCRTHPAEPVKCIKLSTGASQKTPSLICFYCLLSMNENHRKSLVEIPEHLKKIIHYYNAIQTNKSTPGEGNEKSDVPVESAILLEKGREYIKRLKTQGEAEKGTILNFIEIIKKRVLDKLDEKTNIVFKQLDDCIADASARIDILNSNLRRLKDGTSDYHTPSWESLLQKIQKLTNTSDFESLLNVYTRDIQEIEVLREKGPKKAKEDITEVLKSVQKHQNEYSRFFAKFLEYQAIGGLQYLKESEQGETEEAPFVNISKLSEFEKSVSDWSAKISQVVTDLPLSVQLSNSFLKCFNSSKLDSLIVKDNNELMLIQEWLGKGPKAQLNLLYRGSVDGFSAATFHSKCDNRGPTLTVVETTKNKRFGGYAALDWKSGFNNYHNTSACFLFSLDCKEKHAYKSFPEYGMYNNDSYGPTWGGNHDLYISSNCNANNSSYANVGYTYQNPTDGQPYIAGGEHTFTVKEIEVFSVTN